MEKFLDQVEANELQDNIIESRDTLDAQEGGKAGEVGSLPIDSNGDRLSQRRGTGYISAANLEDALRQPSEESKISQDPPIIEKKNKEFVTYMPASKGPTKIQLPSGHNFTLKSCMK